MEIRIAENLRIEAAVPFLQVKHFQLNWKPNEHAMLTLEGYINSKIPYQPEQLYHSKLTLILEQDQREQPLFCGYIIKAESSTVAGMEQLCLRVLSASCLLDQKETSCSFQSMGNTYSETVRQAVESCGGKVICTRGKDTKLNQPFIQFQETAWEFAKRLASHLESSILPDLVTGNPNLWFGMRQGREIPEFPPEEYTVKIIHNVRGTRLHEISYQVESREFYKIGDQTTFLDEPVVVVEATACMKQGELFFTYLLKREYPVATIYQTKFAGLSLPGTISDIKDERIKVAFDIDGGVSTGDYYYPWYPTTGNALYAVPEIGAKIMLYFPDGDERNCFISECFPEKKKKYHYEERCLVLEDGNDIQLFDSLLCVSRGGGQSVSLCDGSIGIGTSKPLRLSAEGKIRMRADRITLRSEDEITIYKR